MNERIFSNFMPDLFHIPIILSILRTLRRSSRASIRVIKIPFLFLIPQGNIFRSNHVIDIWEYICSFPGEGHPLVGTHFSTEVLPSRPGFFSQRLFLVLLGNFFSASHHMDDDVPEDIIPLAVHVLHRGRSSLVRSFRTFIAGSLLRVQA